MKIVLLVYGISWGILLLIYLYSKFFQKPEKKRPYLHRQEPWYLDVSLIVFAPLVVLLAPYILISDVIKNKKQEKWQKEQEEKDRKLKIRKAEVLHHFKTGTVVPIQSECVEKGRQLMNIVREKDYSHILDCLNHLHLPTGCTLDVKLPQQTGMGGGSSLPVTTPTGVTRDVFRTITVEDSPQGAIEVYLLYKMRHYLPAFWHEIYSSRTYIYSMDDLVNIRPLKEDETFSFIEDLKQFDVFPRVVQNSGKYYISCCYWTNWGGLKREHVEVELKDNKVSNIFDADTTTLYKYDCGIVF